MPLKFNPTTGQLDLTDSSSVSGDYLPLAGGTLTGDLTYPATGYIMTDTNGVKWRVTVGTDGTLTTNPVATTPLGSPWLFLFGNI